MIITALAAAPTEAARFVDSLDQPPAGGWMWIDVLIDGDDAYEDLSEVVTDLGLDPLAVHDAVADLDAPKFDDFDDHLVVVLHGLVSGQVETYEIDCFLTQTTLVTVRSAPSRSIEALAKHLTQNADLAAGTADELLARLGDVLSRRFLGVVELLDERLDELTGMALAADPDFLEQLILIRGEAAKIRSVMRPQREVFDQLRTSSSLLLSKDGRRRCSDVYDVLERCVQEFEAARMAAADALGAYQGAEARKATEANKVLTVYAAVLLPLSLLAGIFGMNFDAIPGLRSDRGFVWLMVAMALIAAVSLSVFARIGWIRLPSTRDATRTIGQGLAEATRAPVQLVGVLTRRTRRAAEHRGSDSGED